MLILPGDSRPAKIAIINPALPFGAPGQYTSFAGDYGDMEKQVQAAIIDGNEVRLYHKDLATPTGENIAAQVIVTHIPPGHVQPFHTHHTLHEMTFVLDGSILAIDSDTLNDADAEEIRKHGSLVSKGRLVIEEPGVRHTIMNPNTCYAVLYTVQSARIPLDEFPKDWVRDKPRDVVAKVVA